MRRLLVTLAVLATLWTIAWFAGAAVLEGVVDDGLDRLARDGTQVECTNRETTGFPFAMGIACGSVTVDRDGTTAMLPRGMTALVSILSPTTLRIEPEAELSADVNGVPVRAQWADLAIELRGLLGNGAVHLEADDLRVTQGDTAATLARYEGSVDPDGARTLFDGQGRGLAVSAPGVGPVEASAFRLAGTLDADPRRLDLSQGVSGRISHLTIEDAKGGALGLAGPFNIAPNGLLDGRFTLALAQPDALLATLAKAAPDLARGPAAFAIQALPQLGVPVDVGGIAMRGLEVPIERGRGRLGLFAFEVPPIALP